jgi:hypothetical protein
MAKILCLLYDDPVDGYLIMDEARLAGMGARSYSVRKTA